MTQIPQPQFPCKAKDPGKCRYHGAFVRFAAAVKSNDQEAIATEFRLIQQLQHRPTQNEVETPREKILRLMNLPTATKLPDPNDLMTETEVAAKVESQLAGKEPVFTLEELSYVTSPRLRGINFSLNGWEPELPEKKEALKRVLHELQNVKDAAKAFGGAKGLAPFRYREEDEGAMYGLVRLAWNIQHGVGQRHFERKMGVGGPKQIFYRNFQNVIEEIRKNEDLKAQMGPATKFDKGCFETLYQFEEEILGDWNAAQRAQK